MNILDIIILICFIPALVQGISKGFSQQLASLVAIFAGIWAGVSFADRTALWLGTVVTARPSILHAAGFIIAAVITIIAVTILGRLLSRFMSITMLGWADKLLGIVFALCKAFLLIGIAILLFDSLNSTFYLVKAETLDESALYTSIRDFCNLLFPKIRSLISNA